MSSHDVALELGGCSLALHEGHLDCKILRTIPPHLIKVEAQKLARENII